MLPLGTEMLVLILPKGDSPDGGSPGHPRCCQWEVHITTHTAVHSLYFSAAEENLEKVCFLTLTYLVLWLSATRKPLLPPPHHQINQQQKTVEFYLLWLSSSWLSRKTPQTLSIPDLILHPTHTKKPCFSVPRKNKSAAARAAAFGKAVDLNGSSTPEMSQFKDWASSALWNWRGVGGD